MGEAKNVNSMMGWMIYVLEVGGLLARSYMGRSCGENGASMSMSGGKESEREESGECLGGERTVVVEALVVEGGVKGKESEECGVFLCRERESFLVEVGVVVVRDEVAVVVGVEFWKQNNLVNRVLIDRGKVTLESGKRFVNLCEGRHV